MSIRILQGDCLQTLKTLGPGSVHTCVTSPPYWGLRDYGMDGQLGMEPTPEAYVENMVAVFREVWRVLRDDGTLWLNLGDSYNAAGRSGHGSREGFKQSSNRASAAGQDQRRPSAPALKETDLVGIPWRVAFALQADGWYLRSDIIWHKPNPMPESCTDRPTKAHEYIFLMTKKATYYYDAQAIKEPWKENPNDIKRATEKHTGYDGKHTAGYAGGVRGQPVGDPEGGANKRTVWSVTTKGFPGAHFATFPPDLIEPCIKAGCPADGTVLDPFGGAGTTGLVADRLGRNAVLCELNPEYIGIMEKRLFDDSPLFSDVQQQEG